MWDVIGHDRMLAVLRDSWLAGRLPQSILLTGPRQVGKRTVALALARVLNCAAPEGAPCGKCRACRLSDSGEFPDVHLVQLREGRQRIGIAEVQALQSELARRPTEGQWRVAVIADAERLSAEAENALLKTLEEPPPHAAIVLTTEDAEALLPTTVSRCRRLRLRPVRSAEIEQHLRDRCGLAADQARLLAALADGRPGWAIAATASRELLERRQTALERLWRAVDGGKLARLAEARGLAERWSGKAEEVREELVVWSSWWRDLLLVKLGLVDRLAHVDLLEEVRRQADRYARSELELALALLAQARADLDQNVNPRLALDVALLRLPGHLISDRR
jgi:DNA polymerase-3 subunit delta'